MTLIFVRKDGSKINLLDAGIRVMEFEPESLDNRNESHNINGGGYGITNQGYNTRYIDATFKMQNYDLTDYVLSRRVLFNLFGSGEDFHIIDTKEIGIWWYVRNDNKFSLRRTVKNGMFSVKFVCVTPYAQSRGSCIDLQNHKEWDKDLWSWGMGIDWDKTYSYEHSSNHFSIENIGNALIDPRQHELEITVKATASQYLQITNQTTGDVYKYGGTLTANDTLVLKGIQTLKNGLSVFRDTNKKLITLAPGQNIFTVEGGTIQSIAFNFRFLYH
ncbi:phage tail domain-containing protein [Metasolibacillus sp.]|uniref:phage tail domain-containing protein n=1 Tax=Metasolibacillus sp. TaxID=2703680 RepID=UPI0025D10ADA|nr:phage tail domain-containing protein [Metasolibacillus sp.]MCT6925318.1 phage tail family protein [Metasolibacillus sp.]MCT6941452.1 phage tail family protein [Metasolibacillus sp.]